MPFNTNTPATLSMVTMVGLDVTPEQQKAAALVMASMADRADALEDLPELLAMIGVTC